MGLRINLPRKTISEQISSEFPPATLGKLTYVKTYLVDRGGGLTARMSQVGLSEGGDTPSPPLKTELK